VVAVVDNMFVKIMSLTRLIESDLSASVDLCLCCPSMKSILAESMHMCKAQLNEGVLCMCQSWQLVYDYSCVRDSLDLSIMSISITSYYFLLMILNV